MSLSVRNVVKSYGSGRKLTRAISECSFEVRPGEIVGVVGPNGAGKTTLIRMIAGETTVTSGEIRIGHTLAGTVTARRAVGYVGDPPLLPEELTGVEWLKYLASHRANHPRERTSLLSWAIEFAELSDFVGRRIAGYSRGMAQRLAIAGAAVSGSDAVILDEALGGVDPLVARLLRGTISRLAAERRMVLIASHDLGVIERLATRILILWQGRLVSDVSVASLGGQRIAELALPGAELSRRESLVERFDGAFNTEDGVAIPLTRGVTYEQALAVCRCERIPVAASRVRYKALEDILVEAAEGCDGVERAVVDDSRWRQ